MIFVFNGYLRYSEIHEDILQARRRRQNASIVDDGAGTGWYVESTIEALNKVSHRRVL